MTSAVSTVFVSDVHFSLEPKPELETALLSLLDRYPTARFVFAGDLFEFSSVDTEQPKLALARLVEVSRRLVSGLHQHVARGGSVDWLAGNHDAPVAVLQAEVNEHLGVPVRVLPWFGRYQGVHVEHGHCYDRDNAPLFPLRAWSAREEPVGIALMRRFVTRYDLPDFAHAHQTTPLAGLKRGVTLLGSRVPGLMVAYLTTAIGMCAEAWGRSPLNQSASDTDLQRLESSGVPRAELAEYVAVLLEERATPTHAALKSIFMRLYLDQLATASAVGLGVLGLAAGAGPIGWGGVGLGASYLVASRRLRPHPPYPGPEHALRRAARQLTARLGARAVVFGHSHVPEQTDHYVNLGSFGYAQPGRGRSYATLTDAGVLKLEFLEDSGR
jgi:hypothetical protein